VNILVISSILSIPDILPENDFIYHLYGHYKRIYKEDQLVVIMPVKYDLNLRTILRGKTRLQKLQGKLEWQIEGFRVLIFPFFSAWTLRNLHALVSRSIYPVNRKRIRKLFREQRFDLMHARFIFADGMLAYQLHRKYKVPYVIATHKEMFYFDHFYSRKMAFRIVRQAKLVLPVSFLNLTYFRSHQIQHAFQLSHGFNEGFLKPQRKQINEQVRILSVCRLLDWKNIDQVLRALEMIKDRLDFTYTLIGDGPEKDHLHGLANKLGLEDRVSFVDYVTHEKIAEEMYLYDVFILPSYFETFGRVYFEVMAMGIPVICARNSGIYGLFEENKEGLAVDHTNVREIADTLALLIENPERRKRIGKSGQELVKNYTWDNIARKLHQHYISCLPAT
jgi:glycosyltransferase involved in cell wall biosynthesis